MYLIIENFDMNVGVLYHTQISIEIFNSKTTIEHSLIVHR